MAEGQKYTFDVVVSRFQLDASKANKFNDLSEIKIVVQFNNKMIKISKSRINVDEFKPNTGLDFMASPKKIRKNLEECGIPVQFNYSNKLEGIGLITVPQPTIDTIQENMSDWIYTGTCNVEQEGIIVGQVDLLCRLIVKCDEPKEYVDSIYIYLIVSYTRISFIGTPRRRVQMSLMLLTAMTLCL